MIDFKLSVKEMGPLGCPLVWARYDVVIRVEVRGLSNCCPIIGNFRPLFDIVANDLLHVNCHDSTPLSQISVILLYIKVWGPSLIIIVLARSWISFLIFVRALIVTYVARVIICN